MNSNGDKLSLSVQNLANTNEITIVQAIGELKKSGKDAIPVLVEALKEEGSLCNIAAAVLGEFGEDASEAAEVKGNRAFGHLGVLHGLIRLALNLRCINV